MLTEYLKIRNQITSSNVEKEPFTMAKQHTNILSFLATINNKWLFSQESQIEELWSRNVWQNASNIRTNSRTDSIVANSHDLIRRYMKGVAFYSIFRWAGSILTHRWSWTTSSWVLELIPRRTVGESVKACRKVESSYMKINWWQERLPLAELSHFQSMTACSLKNGKVLENDETLLF